MMLKVADKRLGCRSFAVVLVVLIGTFSASLASAQEKLTRVRIAYPSGGICCLPLYGAIDWKIFQENGLQAEIP